MFGGGGHPAAAGITVENSSYEDTRSRIIEAVKKNLACCSHRLISN
jgi:nanoRNase/pAp phosphatase (c-di-AMP/oligoRNAs hydrolase)